MSQDPAVGRPPQLMGGGGNVVTRLLRKHTARQEDPGLEDAMQLALKTEGEPQPGKEGSL